MNEGPEEHMQKYAVLPIHLTSRGSNKPHPPLSDADIVSPRISCTAAFLHFCLCECQ